MKEDRLSNHQSDDQKKIWPTNMANNFTMNMTNNQGAEAPLLEPRKKKSKNWIIENLTYKSCIFELSMYYGCI